MAPSVSTEIDIAAAPKDVWEVLTDYDSYPEWNPFVIGLSGEKRVGGTLTVTIKPPGSSSPTTFTPTLLHFEPNTHLHWRGRLLNIPWLFTGHHHFHLRPTATGTRFEQSESFSGILALVLQWVGSDVYETTGRGFGMMNEGLKGRVEGREGREKERGNRGGKGEGCWS